MHVDGARLLLNRGVILCTITVMYFIFYIATRVSSRRIHILFGFETIRLPSWHQLAPVGTFGGCWQKLLGHKEFDPEFLS